MMLSLLTAACEGKLHGNDVEYERVSTDTRNILTGDLFIALRGDRFDGHQFVLDAERAGAVALVVDAVQESVCIPQLVVENTNHALGFAGRLNRDSSKAKVIAITGSSGKTTVKGMLHAILANEGEVLATQGNFNNHIGVPLTLLQLKPAHEFAVIEAGTSGKGEIGYLAGLIRPCIALVNNVMSAHLEGFGTVEAIGQEKSNIFSEDTLKIGVVNLKSQQLNTALNQLTQVERIGFALVESDTAMENLREDYKDKIDQFVFGKIKHSSNDKKNEFTLYAENSMSVITIAVPGRHNIENALAAASCALAAGATRESITAGLGTFSGVPGRMQVVESDRCAMLVDDTYNANPGSMRAAIDFLANKKNSVLIVGDMAEVGETAENIHAELGKYAKDNGVSRVYAVGPLSAKLVEKFGDKGQWFESQALLKAHLESDVLDHCAILVKGSRRSKMENIIQQLKRIEEKG
ncbi:UDP-N-acetylmuramoyl-tripeptide--D-alanyl-D-alanine ligase [Teredinibacter purpureus]|uniref:UDP-N-acetylmuramoyl-tripeptide--D-alanyl-D- alanine ligase n=1 Tax=Teredinibacter purpureus TaxID=2731756 RepID=UPI0005F78EA6|nr:UDP-N-acetylmuramoyl-tripeptide--D-alanyl-D-alanine ligase [Teredinibacter purpureus]